MMSELGFYGSIGLWFMLAQAAFALVFTLLNVRNARKLKEHNDLIKQGKEQ